MDAILILLCNKYIELSK